MADETGANSPSERYKKHTHPHLDCNSQDFADNLEFIKLLIYRIQSASK